MDRGVECGGICVEFRSDRPFSGGRLEAGQVLCGQCGVWISRDGTYTNDETVKGTGGVEEWYCRCCGQKVGKGRSNQSEGVDLSYFSKSRAIVLEKITRVLSWEETESSIARFFANDWMMGEIEMEFDAQLHEMIDLVYTKNPPNKLSMIMEFERVRDIVGRVPRKQDMAEHSEISLESYGVEFQSWEHLLERLGYDPWYRKTGTESKDLEETKPDIDSHEEESDMDKIDVLRAEFAIEESLQDEVEITELFKKLCRIVPNLDGDELREMIDGLK